MAQRDSRTWISKYAKLSTLPTKERRPGAVLNKKILGQIDLSLHQNGDVELIQKKQKNNQDLTPKEKQVFKNTRGALLWRK